MANPETTLIPFCWGFIVVVLLMIVVPYLRGKSDLLTLWNLFLLGMINYIGIAGLYAAYRPYHFRILEYTKSDYENYIIGALAFSIPLVLTYTFLKMPRRLAGWSFRKWPPASPSVLYFMLAFSLAFAILGLFPPPIQGVAQFFIQVGNKGIVLAVALAFAAWYRARSNPFLIATLLGVIVLSLVLAIMVGGGRRTMLGVATSIPLCWYWFSLRYKPAAVNVAVFSVLGAVAFVLLLAYSQVRHFDRRGEKKARNFASAVEVLRSLPSATLNSNTAESMFGQNAGQTALTAIQLYTEQHDPEPFHSVFYVSTIWIPRVFWEDKPKGLGYTLPKTAKVHGTRATWGPNIIGHGYHEGGPHMLVIYGVMMGFFLRYMDELLVRQPRNAYLLAAVSAMSGHVFGWTRGDIGTYTVQIIGAFLILLIVGILGRMLFGTGVRYPWTGDSAHINTNLFALRYRKPEQAAPTDFDFRSRDET